MPQLAIYLDARLARRLDAAARRSRTSRSRFVADLLRRQLDDRLPDSFFDVFGTWEDERSPREIVRDIRRGMAGGAREPIR